MRHLTRSAPARYRLVALLVAVLALVPISAQALPVTNLDTIDLSSATVVASSSSSFVSPTNTTLASLVTNVYFDEATDLYTYVMAVTPTVTGIKVVNTGYLGTYLNAHGFNGVIGWSFADAALAANAGFNPAVAFNITQPQGTNWGVTTTAQFAGFWNAAHLTTVDLFFQSYYGPRADRYNVMTTANVVGSTMGLAPVPEPGSLLLLGSGAVTAGVWLRRRAGRRRSGTE